MLIVLVVVSSFTKCHLTTRFAALRLCVIVALLLKQCYGSSVFYIFRGAVPSRDFDGMTSDRVAGVRGRPFAIESGIVVKEIRHS